GRLIDVDGCGLVNRPKIDIHVPEPGTAYGERHSERDCRRALGSEFGQARCDVHIGGRQNACIDEFPQDAVDLTSSSNFERSDHCFLRIHAVVPLSSTSLSCSKRPLGGCQAKTPQGFPSTTGVLGPLIPRRNRYCTPPKSRFGS